MSKFLGAACVAAVTAALLGGVPVAAHAAANPTVKFCTSGGAASISGFATGVGIYGPPTQTDHADALAATGCGTAFTAQPGGWQASAVPGSVPTPGYPGFSHPLSVLGWTVSITDAAGTRTSSVATQSVIFSVPLDFTTGVVVVTVQLG